MPSLSPSMSLKLLRKLSKTSASQASFDIQREVLPQEIFNLVLEYICDAYGLSEVERAEQSIYGFPLLFVCRSWHFMGLRYLYTSIAPRTTSACRLLLRTLNRSKDIPPLIRSLLLPRKGELFVSSARNAVLDTLTVQRHHSLIEAIVRKCPALTHLRIPIDGWPYFDYPRRTIANLTNMSALVRLTSLHVAAFNSVYRGHRGISYDKVVEWFAQVDVLPHLEFLTISDVVMNLPYDVPTKWPSMPRLHTLLLERTGFMPAGAPSLLLQTAPTLKTLRLSGRFDRPEEEFQISEFLECAIQSIKIVAATIEDLYIVCPSYYHSCHHGFRDWDKKDLPHLINNKHLHISACLLNDKILSHLSSSKLENLTIEFHERENGYYYGKVRQTLNMDCVFAALPESINQVIFRVEAGTTLEGWEIVGRQASVEGETDKLEELENPYFAGDAHALSARAVVIRQRVYELAKGVDVRLRMHLELPVPPLYA
ncbi:hypothetical protein M422DRAFT_783444 [Sphaerobolus stellatus SS14]|uniref:Uncharacterized protein n=1 Tax=Sphaerobolus stellatus (strain SS14) TaxID=990650 RepID=A0A0C9V4W7_SPHS4|nr:hypothetical protein M422DRAFT_783444 [Sphaerobolus stellatus SS14]